MVSTKTTTRGFLPGYDEKSPDCRRIPDSTSVGGAASGSHGTAPAATRPPARGVPAVMPADAFELVSPHRLHLAGHRSPVVAHAPSKLVPGPGAHVPGAQAEPGVHRVQLGGLDRPGGAPVVATEFIACPESRESVESGCFGMIMVRPSMSHAVLPSWNGRVPPSSGGPLHVSAGHGGDFPEPRENVPESLLNHRGGTTRGSGPRSSRVSVPESRIPTQGRVHRWCPGPRGRLACRLRSIHGRPGAPARMRH